MSVIKSTVASFNFFKLKDYYKVQASHFGSRQVDFAVTHPDGQVMLILKAYTACKAVLCKFTFSGKSTI